MIYLNSKLVFKFHSGTLNGFWNVMNNGSNIFVSI